MLKRKFYYQLLEWKKTKKNECLLVNGARQIGKTFIIEQFGKDNYESYIYLNFIKNPELKNIFEGSLESNEVFKRISLYVPDCKFIEGNTLIFIDEIQISPKARTALKFLALDSRYDVIASGSLLGIHYNKSKEDKEIEKELSIPVGYEREVLMHSLDFEEFLWARGVSDKSIAILKEYFDKKEKVPAGTESKNWTDGLNEKYLSLLREYMVVGGMPEVVNKFLETSNYQEVHAAQQKIFKAYEDDIEQYAKNV